MLTLWPRTYHKDTHWSHRSYKVTFMFRNQQFLWYLFCFIFTWFKHHKILIAIKMKKFSNIKYPFLPGNFIYFVRRFSTKQIKYRYLYEMNANPSGNKWGNSTNFCVKKLYFHCTREKMMDWGTKNYRVKSPHFSLNVQ